MSPASRVALDTSAYSHLRGGDEGIASLVEQAVEVSIPAIVLGELDAAFRWGARRKDNESRLREFLEAPFVRVLDVTPDVARRYGQIASELRAAGTPIPSNDIWIAATVMDAGAQLLTFDGDFERVKGLDLSVFATR